MSTTLTDEIISKMKFGERGSIILSEHVLVTSANLPDILKPAVDKAFELNLEIRNEFVGTTRAVLMSWRPREVTHNLIKKYGPIDGWHRQTILKQDADEFPLLKTEMEKYVQETVEDIKYEAKLMGIELLIDGPEWVEDYQIEYNTTWLMYGFRWTQAKQRELEAVVIDK
jgi:hypothetical protein